MMLLHVSASGFGQRPNANEKHQGDDKPNDDPMPERVCWLEVEDAPNLAPNLGDNSTG